MKAFKVISGLIYIALAGYFFYAGFNGKAFWDSSKVERNTEYSGKRIYTGYGNRFNHK